MKILVISDSHGEVETLLKIIEKESPKIIIFCGDFIKDIIDMEYLYKEITFIKVRGNCDLEDYNSKDEIITEIKNIKIFITHGHLYDVKNNLNSIIKKARQNDINIVIFGHTHKTYLEKIENNLILLNPGAVKDGAYGIILIKDNQNKIFLKNIK